MRDHLVIPDTQIKPGVCTDHIGWAGQYIREHRPGVIVILGDWYDYPSLSRYDKGTAQGQAKFVSADEDAGDNALKRLIKPWIGLRTYSPQLEFLLGNHENRKAKYLNEHPELFGTLPSFSPAMDVYGWRVHSFLDPVYIDGVCYSHFFPRGADGSVNQQKNGSPNSKVQLQRQMTSCTAGHKPGFDYTCRPYPPGGNMHSIIAGSFYMHDLGYRKGDGNNHWNGIIHKRRVSEGDYDLQTISVDLLEESYG